MNETPTRTDGADTVEPAIDEIWAYRARGVDPLTPARVVRFGQRKPPRVLVRFESDAMEGREEWVPHGRLKAPWSQLEEFVAHEARWRAVRDLSPGRDSAELTAVHTIFECLVDFQVADVDHREGFLLIRDGAALSEQTALSVEDLTNHELTFESNGRSVAPWPVALRAAKSIAERMPDQVLAQVEKEEREFQRTLVHGFSWNRDREVRDIESEAEIAREVDEEGYRQSRDLRREWVGAAVLSRNDELRELRKEIRRIGRVAEDAIETLRHLGHRSEAERLALILGQTVEILREEKG